MKRLTATFADDAKIDLGALAGAALDFRIEQIADDSKKANGQRVVPHRHSPANNSVQKVIMDHYTPSGRFYADDAKKWVASAQYNPLSASPAISALTDAGYLSQTGDRGRFQYEKAFKKDQLKA